MKKIVLISASIIMLASCKKDIIKSPEATHPAMQYLVLNDTSVVFNRSASFDLDGNGSKDIFFSTLLVGDPVSKEDKKQWLVSSSFYANLPVNVNEEIPVMQKADSIPVTNFSGYTWYNASTILIAQKILTDSAPPYWEGSWKNTSKRFIPIQVIRDGKFYNGWVEISFSTTHEKVIVHRAAVCTEPNTAITAGS